MKAYDGIGRLRISELLRGSLVVDAASIQTDAASVGHDNYSCVGS